MLLHHLVRQLDVVPGSGIPNVEITGVCEDSRQVRPVPYLSPGPGTKADGKQFLADAKVRGAVAAVVQSQVAGTGLPQIVVKDPGIAASYLANAFYDHPGRLVRTLAVTGTNGKTTTTYIVRHLLAKLGLRCGLIGTVEIDDGRTRREASMTTPARLRYCAAFWRRCATRAAAPR